ncbi:3 beta-hydroxysteroid dehydrogenase type 7-like protein [Sarcoptes scabiei]|uniref:3 beta-hydroxysteroid dehydrogenase type 7-like protein n=2 Tax=Sarcoptes scabiei TaxID=52283 RepID=A0A131ZWD2_SARSC|nr:3 beta-hydroxysteroid dehydrogenase type 7-like protein [Sarcoptes scabiei]
MIKESHKQIVLVTGSSGCLGQHIVKLLHENDDTVQEIRCFDIKPFQNNLQFKITKEMQIITADIRNEVQLLKALNGVDVIIHCAALIDVSLFPDESELQSINVEATQKLIDCAIECNVPYFIHVSGLEAVIGDDNIYYSTEHTTIQPTKHLLGPYARTKFESDEIVRDANERPLANGIDNLLTVILRPTVFYGEQDNNFITKVFEVAKWNSNLLRRLDNIYIQMHPVYVGNVAHACLRAKEKMLIERNIGGEEFFINDDTKFQNPFDFFEPYLKARGFQLSKRSYPYWLFILIFSFYCCVIKMIRNFIKIKLPSSLTPATITYIVNTYFVNRNKATLRLDYDPLYTNEESHKRSIEYYRNVPI